MADNNEDIELDITDASEIEVDVETAEFSEDEKVGSEDSFAKAETATQKRISRLTKKMREAERREQEAIKYAQAVQGESQNLKNRMSSLDTSYVTEYTNRVNTQISQAEAKLTRAMELGDSQASVEAQRELTSLAIQQDRASQAKLSSDRAQQQAAAAQQHQARQPMPAQQPRRPDAKAEQWALRNSWFGSDEAMTYAAFGIHKKLVEDEGFDPSGEDYYTELDRRVADKFGNGANAAGKRPAQTVIGASRTPSGRTGRKVRLTPSQVAIAKKLGVPLEDAPPAPDGFKHRWIRAETRGFDDTKNISAKIREGYELVRKDEYPDYESPTVETGKYQGVFGAGGLLLARIPDETVAERTNYFNKRSKDQMDAVDHDMMRENAHSSMTISNPDRQSRVTFGGPQK